MNARKPIEIAEPEIEVAKPEIARELLTEPDTEGQVIVHGSFHNALSYSVGIRFWRTTFLRPVQSSHCSKLVHLENIALQPQWTSVAPGTRHYFTLIFAPLPKSCKIFHLLEEITESGAFEIHNIQRNKQDVYHLDFS